MNNRRHYQTQWDAVMNDLRYRQVFNAMHRDYAEEDCMDDSEEE